jgi:hypothetical protein
MAIAALSAIAFFGFIEAVGIFQLAVSTAALMYKWVLSPSCNQIATVCTALEGVKKLVPMAMGWTFFGLRLLALPVLVGVLLSTRGSAEFARWWARISFYLFGALIALLMVTGVTGGGFIGSLKQVIVLTAQVAATALFLWSFDRSIEVGGPWLTHSAGREAAEREPGGEP